jgi:hypothetical protein
MNPSQFPQDDVNHSMIIHRPRIHELTRLVNLAPENQNLFSFIFEFLLCLRNFSSKARDIVYYINSKKPQSIRDIEDFERDYLYKT